MTGIKVCIITVFLTAIYLIFSVFICNIFFHKNASGSLISINNKIIGSKLIGQEFKSNKYFHGRPSSINYQNNISGCSNFPFYSKELRENTSELYMQHLKLNEIKPDLNLIVESASGLDPDITYEGALSQINRVSKHTMIKKEELKKIIDKKSKPSILGLFGQKIVNVLELNLELKNAKTTGS